MSPAPSSSVTPAPGGTSASAGPAASSGPAATSESAASSERGGAEYECARAWSALTAAHTRVAGRLSDALAQGFGLTINDFEILLRVDHAPDEGVRLGELSSAVPLTQPALSRAVARLAARGAVTRSGVPLDRRGVLITMTPAGRDLLRRAIPVHAGVVREVLLDRLSPEEQDVLARVLTRVASGA